MASFLFQNLMSFLRAQKSIPLFVPLLTGFLALGWLLPNHYPPWLAFHANAWVGLALTLILLRQVLATREVVEVGPSAMLLLTIATLPALQHFTGQLPLPSDAALRSLCLLGAAVAFVLAQRWNKTEPQGAAGCVLTAMTIAAIASTGIATYQWLGLAQDLDLTDIWILPFAEGTRPYGNMGQPNQLASLLLCGLLGLAWVRHKRHIGNVVALIASAWVVWGIALTESRTAILTFGLATAYLSISRPHYIDRLVVRCTQVLFIFYLACLFGKSALAQALELDLPLSLLERSAGEIRTALWKMSLEASLQNPWFGYGIGRSNAGYFLVFEKYQTSLSNTYFDQSHNLILDLALWVGWPLTIGCTLIAGVWLYRIAKNTKSAGQLIALMALFVLLIHAMLEFPLHYAYFLWPFFIFLGSAAKSSEKRPIIHLKISRKSATATLVTFFITIFIITTDYLKIEESFTELRFQVAHIGSGHNETPPSTIILKDWPEAIALARKQPQSGMTDDEIHYWEALLMYNTSPLVIRKVVGANRLNGKEAEAKAWANRACWLLSEKACRGLLDEWPAPESGVSPHL